MKYPLAIGANVVSTACGSIAAALDIAINAMEKAKGLNTAFFVLLDSVKIGQTFSTIIKTSIATIYASSWAFPAVSAIVGSILIITTTLSIFNLIFSLRILYGCRITYYFNIFYFFSNFIFIFRISCWNRCNKRVKTIQ